MLIDTLIEALLIASILSIDLFAVSFAYGSNRIHIPMKYAHIINVVCSSMLALSLILGSILSQYISEQLAIIVGFVILLFLGTFRLRSNIKKPKSVKLTKSNTKPQRSRSRKISLLETFSLGIALSIDGIAVGFSAAMWD